MLSRAIERAKQPALKLKMRKIGIFFLVALNYLHPLMRRTLFRKIYTSRASYSVQLLSIFHQIPARINIFESGKTVKLNWVKKLVTENLG